MALPPSVNRIPIHGKITAMDDAGTPAVGSITFVPSQTIRNTTDKVVLAPRPKVVTLDVTGAFTVTPGLIATDDPDMTPSGWTWIVAVDTDIWKATFNIAVPVATPGTLELADIVAVEVPASVGVWAAVGHTHTDSTASLRKNVALSMILGR